MILALCILLLIIGSYAPLGREQTEETNRVVWVAIFACFILAWAMPNVWLGGLLALIGIGIRALPQPHFHVQPHVYPALMWAGLYVVMTSLRSAWTIPLLLGGILAVGCLSALWTIHSLCILERPYIRTYKVWRWKLILWEPKEFGGIVASLGNPNHSYAVYCTGLASAIGLVLLDYWWATAFIGLMALPILAVLFRGDGTPHASMLHGYLAALLLSVGPLWFGLSGWIASIGLGAGLMAWSWIYHIEWWSGRNQIWGWAWQHLRSLPWHTQAVGLGTGAWLPLMESHRPFHEPATNPHNEFMGVLIDHGFLGVSILCTYLATAFWKASQAGPAGKAVFLVGAVLTLCAFVSFPWNNYLEVGCYDDKTNRIKMSGHGATALNVISLATAVLVEAL